MSMTKNNEDNTKDEKDKYVFPFKQESLSK